MSAETTAAEIVRKWNAQYPVGTPVEYWTPTGQDRRCGRTRSLAAERDGIPGVLVAGLAGMVDLANVQPLQLGAVDKGDLDTFCEAVLSQGNTVVRIDLDALGAMALLGALQLVLRHPLLGGGVGQMYRDLAAEIEAQLPKVLRPLAAKGWNSVAV